MTMQGSQRPSEQDLRLDGQRYQLLASLDEIVRGLPSGLKRSWTWEPIEVQNVDVTREFEIALNDFSRGYGVTFADEDGFYEGPRLTPEAEAAGYRTLVGWDAGPTGIRTWTRIGEWTDSAGNYNEAVSLGHRGFILEHNGAFYVFKGRYVIKLGTTPISLSESTNVWIASILPGEVTDLGVIDDNGNDAIVANHPVKFGGDIYVPMKIATTGVAERFARLSTQNTHVNAVVEFAISGGPATGTWTITYQGYTSDPIAIGADWPDVIEATATIPGWSSVTGSRSGSTPNYTYTLTMNGVGGAQDPPAAPDDTMGTIAAPDTFDAGAVGVTVTTAAVTDLWDHGRGYGGDFEVDPDIKAIAFAVFHHPISGPTLARADSNLVYLNSGDPLDSADWGSGYEVGDASIKIANLFTYGDDLIVWKEDGTMWLFDAQGVAKQIPDVRGVGAPGESVNATTWFGRQYIPTANGLIEWRPGASRTIGPEQDRRLDASRSPGSMRVKAMLPHGDRLYYVGWDAYRNQGVLGSFTPTPRSERMPLTPHLHHVFPWLVEDMIKIEKSTQAVPYRSFDEVSDDSAVGTIEWDDPDLAEEWDPVYAANVQYASASGSGITHYLKALNLDGGAIPYDADITGIELNVVRRKVATADIELVGQGAQVTQSGFATIAPSTHADVLTDDFLLANVTSSQAVNTPSGWNALFSTGGSYWFWRLAPADGAQAFTFTTAASAVALMARITAYRNVDTADPIGVTGTQVSDATSASLSIPSVTTVGSREMVLGFHYGQGGAVFTDNTPTPGAWELGANLSMRVGGFTYAASVSGFLASAAATVMSGYTVAMTEVPSLVHTARFFTLNPTSTADVVDDTVKLVVGGVVSGNDKASATQWGSDWEGKTYGGNSDLWGLTPTASEVMSSSFGAVLSADITSGTAQVDLMRMKVYYSLDGSEDVRELLIVLGQNEDDLTTEGFQVWDLPRLGLTPFEDDSVQHVVQSESGNTWFATARYRAPGFEIEKVYRAVELYVEYDATGNQNAVLEVWASVDDGEPFQLLEDSGADVLVAASIQEPGFHRVFFPADSRSVGRYVQIFFKPLMAFYIHGSATGSGFTVHSGVKIRGSYRVESGRLHTFVVKLEEGARYADGGERRSIGQMVSDLEGLRSPGAGDSAPVVFRRPDGVETYGEVIAVQAQEVDFKGANAGTRPGWIAVLRVREMPYA